MGFSPHVYRQEEPSMMSIGMDRQLVLPILGFEIRDSRFEIGLPWMALPARRPGGAFKPIFFTAHDLVKSGTQVYGLE